MVNPQRSGPGIRAIVFDCFGVLYDDALKALVERHVTPDSPHPARYYYDLALAADRGLVSDDDFYAELHNLSGDPVPAIKHHLRDVSTLNPDVVTMIDSLRPRYRIGLLSNAERSFLDRFLANHNLAGHFDAVVASSETPYVKPQPGIFEIMAERLGITFAEMLFIDDSSTNVTAAEDYGIASILYTSAPRLRQALTHKNLLA